MKNPRTGTTFKATYHETPLGLPYADVGQLAQAFGNVLVERGYTLDVIRDRLRDAGHFDEVLWWEIAGPLVDEFAAFIDLPPFPEEPA